MKFMFCNFLGESYLERENHKGVRFIEESPAVAEENVSFVDVYKVNDANGVQGLKFVAEGEVCIGEKLDFIGAVEDKEEHTDANPLIVVATSKFKVFKGIPTHIKYIPVKGGVVVALLSGYIAVAGPDGELVPLSRNCDAVSDNEGHVFTAEEILNMNGLEDKESGVKYSNYVVNDCVIKLTVAKDNRYLKTIKFNKDKFVMLNQEIFDKAKAKKEAEVKAREERKRIKEAENAKYMANRAIREKAKLEREEAEKVEKATSKKAKTSKAKVVEEDEYSAPTDGARAFLEFVAKHRS